MFDLIITNIEVVRPGHPENAALDIAITDGQIVKLEPSLDRAEAKEVFDGGGLLAFAGWLMRTCTLASTTLWRKTSCRRVEPLLSAV